MRRDDRADDRALDELYARIDARARALRAAAPDWPCAAGCDDCCHRLAAPPLATPAEWRRLDAHLARLPQALRDELRRALAQPVDRLCPLLEPGTGRCRVYEGRPAACRTYGFYAGRDGGRWCARIQARTDLAGLVLGNHDALEADVRARLGDPVELHAWFARRSPPLTPDS